MKKRWLLLLLLPFWLGSRQMICKSPPRADNNFFAMNTFVSITAYGEQATDALKLAAASVQEFEDTFSVTDSQSELYAINHRREAAVPVSGEVAALTSYSLEMAKSTDGCFDPTIYPVLTSWGFTTAQQHVPSQKEIDSLLPLVGYEKVTVKGNHILLEDGVQLDLGAVAKGYAGDQVEILLREQGISSALVNLGGNIQAIGTKPDGSLRKVGLKSPDGEGYIGTLGIADCAVITSGGYQNFFVGDDGTTYHHILDPTTGYPSDSGLLSATIVGKEGKQCDALSTALFVMGAERAINYWRTNGGFEMLLLTEDHEILITQGLEDAFALHEDYENLPVVVIP